MKVIDVSERRAWRVIGQARSTLGEAYHEGVNSVQLPKPPYVNRRLLAPA